MYLSPFKLLITLPASVNCTLIIMTVLDIYTIYTYYLHAIPIFDAIVIITIPNLVLFIYICLIEFEISS